ncbi:MAG: hypothetical protein VKK04_09175 [Synechococcales bacterium]|nr:hypothetical protein [Synechococcales bacterium]
MTTAAVRNLGMISLTTLLVSAHYGLGFILGTAEKTFTVGAQGSLYAVTVGLGMMALGLLAPFYWQRIDPLWTLLGDRYGQPVKVGIGVMSWASFIGIEAVQIISAAAIFEIIGFPRVLTMVGIAGLFCLLSLLPLERASWLFRGLLLLNVLVLGAALWRLDQGMAYGQVVLNFWPAAGQGFSPAMVGVALSTWLLVLIDMKCQQFVVRSQSATIARWSCVAAGAIFVVLAFLPTALVTAAQQADVLPGEITGKTVIPYILGWLGGGTHSSWGILCIASLALPALGLGSNVLRIQTKANLDILHLDDVPSYRAGFAGLNAALTLGIALRGGEIVGLIVCFYAAYLSAVWVPFLAYLLEQAKRVAFSVVSVRFALLMGGVAALLTLGVSLFLPDAVWFGSPELNVLVMGLGFSSLGLLTAQGVESLPILLKQPRG